jgi:hypothetical protein
MESSTRLALRIGVVFAGICLLAQPAAQKELGSASVPLRVDISPECDAGITRTNAEPARTDEQQRFVSGTVGIRYRIRTGKMGGGGALHLRLDGMRNAASVSYRVSLEGTGTAASGEEPVAASGSTEMIVVRFGPNQHSASRGDYAAVAWQVRYPESQDHTPAPAPQVSCRVH